MEEATALCNRLVVMDRGRILVEGTPQDLIRRYIGDHVIEIPARQNDKAHLVERLRHFGYEVEDRGDSLCLYTKDGVLLPDEAVLDGYQTLRRPGNLEDVFLRLTGRGLREE
jgi:lipooligosaccharide transport system ATP-binding protein